MPRRKPFIDKKHATTYRLIPGFVPDTENDLPKTEEEVGERKTEQRKYGIFYGDNYDYMQHLRSLTEGATMVKVSDLNNMEDEVRSSYGGSVHFKIFSSEVEPKEEHIDPDILASLDEAPEVKLNEEGDMECEDDANFLDDDFINQAGGYEPKPEKKEDHGNEFDIDDQDLGSDFDGYYNEDFEDEDDDDSYDDRQGISQPVGRGNVQDDIIEAQTALILKNFEEGLGFSCVAQDIDDDDGRATAEDYENLKEILMQDKLKEKKMTTASEFLNDHADRPKFNYSKYCQDDDQEEFEWKELPPSKPQFDCVSILSLNSNTRNLPTDLIPPSSGKNRLKKPSTSETDPSCAPGLSQRELEEEIRLSRKADKASTFRPQDETLDERKNRKKAIKDERKERRQEKKANKIVFSMEKQKMDKEVAALSKCGTGMKLS